MSNEELTAWAVTSDDPDAEPDISLGSFYGCVTAGRRIAGVTNSSSAPFWVDEILLGHEQFPVRPRVHVAPGRTAWFDLEGWPDTVYERRWPVLELDPAAFGEHVLSRPMGEWMRDVERQDMRRIFGG